MNHALQHRSGTDRSLRSVESRGLRAWLSRRSLPVRLLLLVSAVALPLMALAAACVAGWYFVKASRFPMSAVTETLQPVQVVDSRGAPLFTLGSEIRPPLRRSEIPDTFVNALLAREDHRFRSHFGVDFQGAARAAVRNYKDGRATQGASTITMQLVRLTYGFREKTIDRKLLEMALAMRLERNYSKDEILTWYANRVLFGPGLVGLEAASRAYFDKTPADLTLAESATLAAGLRNPAGLNPLKYPDRAREERNVVLTRMAEEGLVSTDLAARAAREPMAVNPPAKPPPLTRRHPLAEMVERELEEISGGDTRTRPGMRVVLTLDSELQRRVETRLEAHLRTIEALPNYPRKPKGAFPEEVYAETPYLQGACVILDHSNGDILAIAGGRDTNQSRFNRAVSAKRPVGSLFKPFVYALAYAQGLNPHDLVSDAPLSPEEIPETPDWNPKNADNKSLGDIPAEMGLVWSRNTVTVRVGRLAGLARVSELAGRLGMKGPSPVNSQIMIGNIGASCLDLAAAYGMLAEGGRRPRPRLIRRVEDAAGNAVYQGADRSDVYLKPGESALTLRALTRVLGPEGTARDASAKWGVDFPAAGKTGTTNDCADAWFAGTTDQLSCVVWVGMDKPQSILPGGLGSTLALPLWAEVVKDARALGHSADARRIPVASSAVRLCRMSRQPASQDCEKAGLAYSIASTEHLASPCPHDHSGAIAKGDLWRELRYFIGAE